MGIFDILGTDRGTPRPGDSRLGGSSAGGADAKLSAAADGLVERLLSVGIDGRGTFDSAATVAGAARARRGDPERAIDDIVAEHTRLAAASGFVTGLGGFVTLPVALPANVAGFYLLATRMAAAIAHVRGYQIDDARVRSAILLSLVGAGSGEVLTRVGYSSTGKLAEFATQRLPGPVLMAINKGVAFRMLTRIGRSAFARVGRGVPLVGGVLGAGLDGYLIRRIADHVRTEFPAQGAAGQLTAG